MKILVTGANGFLGTHLVSALEALPSIKIITHTRSDEQSAFFSKLTEADFIFHLAGVNRPKNKDEFLSSNVQLTAQIVNFLEINHISTTIYFSSSIHSEILTDYGVSKLACEGLLNNFKKKGNRVIIHRLMRIFGPGARPNYNSVVATFCDSIARNLVPQITDCNLVIQISFVSDWVSLMINLIKNPSQKLDLHTYHVSLGNLLSIIKGFKDDSRDKIDGVDAVLVEKLRLTYKHYETLV